MWRVLVILLFSFSAYGSEWIESNAIKNSFDYASVSGAFVYYDRSNERYVFHNRDRLSKRFIPASTFKIPNALIGLSLGVVGSVDELLPYGGAPQRVKSWENDMSLKQAIKISNLPIFQELARRIGVEKMQAEIEKMAYGNSTIGTDIDRFWLDGPLKISAVEQVEFLSTLAESELPLSQHAQRATHDILLLESIGDCHLFAKTGWLANASPGIGWWVGWVDNKGHIVSFALNMDILVKNDAKKRVGLGKRILSESGIWPCS